MKKLSMAAALITLAVLAVPQSAGAEPACASGASVSICRTLDDCYVVGAVNLDVVTPADAVRFYQGCTDTDQRFQPPTAPYAGQVGLARARPLAIYESTFWPLLCEALRRSGNDSSCRITLPPPAAYVPPADTSPSTPRKRRHARKHASRRPAFTADRGRHASAGPR